MSPPAKGLSVATAIILGIAPLRGAAGDETKIWTYPIPGQEAVQMDLPSSWTEVRRDEKDRTVRFRPSNGVRAELTVALSWNEAEDPLFNGPSRLQELVEESARGFLDQAVESRITIRELRGPRAGGHYWVLRDRAPRKKWAVYVTRGMVGTGAALLDFTLLTSRADLPEIRQALKMLAGVHQSEPESGTLP